jgi:sugar-specific transcriptional regulator TrmB
MQAVQMSVVLREIALLLEESGSLTSATELRCLADALSFGGTETVAKIVTKIQKNWKSSKRGAAYPSSLKTRLERIASVLNSSGAAKSAKNCRVLLKLFSGDTSEHAQDFSSDLRSAIQTPAPATQPKRTKPTRKPLDATAARAIADRLTTASNNNAQFDAAVAELEADTQIKKAELEMIASSFLGSKRSFKSKAEIFKVIRNRQIQDAIQSSRNRRGEKIAV